MRYCVIASPLLDALYAALPRSRHRAASSMRSSHSMSPLAWDGGTGASASQGIAHRHRGMWQRGRTLTGASSCERCTASRWTSYSSAVWGATAGKEKLPPAP